MFSLIGKSALVTGGASGIGLAIAQRFVSAGADVVIADLQDGSTIAGSINCQFIQADVSKPESVQTMFRQANELVGKLDILVNNAGINGQDGVSFEDSDNDLTRKIFDVNTFSVIYGLKYGPAAMNDHGSIINTASLAASYMFPGSGPYSASKAAVANVTQMAAVELADRKIRVNAVAPAFIRTPMVKGDEAIFEKIAEATTCAQRIAEVEDIAAAYHFLASDDSRYINAQILNLDAGMSVGMTQAELELILSK